MEKYIIKLEYVVEVEASDSTSALDLGWASFGNGDPSDNGTLYSTITKVEEPS